MSGQSISAQLGMSIGEIAEQRVDTGGGADVEMRLQAAQKLRAEGKAEEAQRICKELLLQHPDYVGALFELGMSYLDRQEYSAATEYLSRCAMHCPNDHRLLARLAGCYAAMGAIGMAVHTLNTACGLHNESDKLHHNLGKLLQDSDCEKAIAHFEKALQLRPDAFDTAIRLAVGYELVGRMADAADLYHRSLEMKPGDLLRSLAALSELPSSLVRVDLRQLMEKVGEPTSGSVRARANLPFTRARILDKLGRYAEAWSCAEAANVSVFRTSAEKLTGDEAYQAQMLEWARDRVAGFSGPQDPPPEGAVPLFVLGPSRSGKSSVEQLLGRFKAVKRGYENSLIPDAVRTTRQLAGRLSQDSLASLPSSDYAMFATLYADELRKRSGQSAVFTTTNPNVIAQVPRVLAALPHAKFVFVKRDRDDLALRIFFKNYQSGHYFAYDLAKIYSYIDYYYSLVDIYLQKYPGNTTLVHYEELVANPADVARRLAGFCGIDEEPVSMAELGSDVGCSDPYRDMLKAAKSHVH